MRVMVLEVAGYQSALHGLSLSWGKHDVYTPEGMKKMEIVADKLAGKGGGHDKFLRQIVAWLEVEAPRKWWVEADTYNVGNVRQSDSTMHALLKKPVTLENFEYPPHPRELRELNRLIEVKADVNTIKEHLPEGFLQTKVVSASYASLRNVYHQRKSHRLPQWGDFCQALMMLPYSNLIL